MRTALSYLTVTMTRRKKNSRPASAVLGKQDLRELRVGGVGMDFQGARAGASPGRPARSTVRAESHGGLSNLNHPVQGVPVETRSASGEHVGERFLSSSRWRFQSE